MAAWGYEFYLRVLQVLSAREDKIRIPSGHVMFCLLYRY